MLSLGKQELSLEQGIRREWVLSNGVGGYASSTALGANARKWHGLLVARAGGERMLLASKLEEWIETEGEKFSLASNFYPNAIHPDGFRHLARFSLEPLPEYSYSFKDVRVTKTIAPFHGENTTVVRYAIQSDSPFSFSAAPFLSGRPANSVSKSAWLKQKPFDRKTLVDLGNGATLLACSDACAFSQKEIVFQNVCYPLDQERGEGFEESLFCPGLFSASGGPGETIFHIAFSLSRKSLENPGEVIDLERERLERVVSSFYSLSKAKRDVLSAFLALSADSFINKLDPTTETIFAGFPWFEEWGRDALISLPGLLLSTGRFETAASVLLRFASSCRNGLIPNFTAKGKPSFNSADASLWFALASFHFLNATHNAPFTEKNLYPKIKEIIRAYSSGIKGVVSQDADSLLSVSPAMTWMDGKVGATPITPRGGKPVEINALWFNALKIGEVLSSEFRDAEFNSFCKIKSAAARKSFEKFWNPSASCLFDVLDPLDASVRPNQLFAVSLPFRLLEEHQERLVIEKIWKELYTPLGLRTLSPRDPAFKPFYNGSLDDRTRAYHQGTVWPWLLGHFLTALHRLKPGVAIVPFFSPFEDHLRVHGLGSVSEVFEADSLRPDGCISQAWSVAELLRAKVELGV